MQWMIIIPAVLFVLLIIFALVLKRWKSGGDSMSAWNGHEDEQTAMDGGHAEGQVTTKTC